jgi:hypothetical protein
VQRGRRGEHGKNVDDGRLARLLQQQRRHNILAAGNANGDQAQDRKTTTQSGRTLAERREDKYRGKNDVV